ncbi:MAG: hypothetical protein AB1515_09555 [Nitrospirota bacterium]
MHRRARVLLILAIPTLAGCLVSTVRLSPAPPSARTRLLQTDPATAWTVLLEVVERRNLPILALKQERGWLETDFTYFHPMEFGVPILDGTLLMGSYLDVKGGRYRLFCKIAGEGAYTSVSIDARIERLEARHGAAPLAEPSYSLDAPARRDYLVRVPQPSNGVIEELLFKELESSLARRHDGQQPARAHNGRPSGD